MTNVLRKKYLRGLAGTFCLLLAFAASAPLSAAAVMDSVPPAEAAYAAGDYGAALKLYSDKLPKNAAEVQSADARLSDVYYDMGNCAFRLKDYPRAVLYYTRALRHDPSNGDASSNLELTRSKLSIQTLDGGGMFFVSWLRAVRESLAAAQWGYAVWGCLLLVAAGMFLFYLTRRLWLRKCGIAVGVAGVICTLLCFGFAAERQHAFASEARAVVLRPVPCFATPTATAAKVRDLREGTVMTMTGAENGAWLQVSLPDGGEAWLRKDAASFALVSDLR